MKNIDRRVALVAAALLCLSFLARSGDTPPAPKLKEEMRQPWTRNDTNYIKNWMLAGPSTCPLEAECTDVTGAEATAGSGLAWEPTSSWGDVVTLYGDAIVSHVARHAEAFAYAAGCRSGAD